MNFFSGHNMANNIMRQTSPTLQMREYQNDYNVGRVRTEEFHPERLNVDYETTKLYLPVPEPTVVVRLPELRNLVNPVSYAPRCAPTTFEPFDFQVMMEIRAEKARKTTPAIAAGLALVSDLDDY